MDPKDMSKEQLAKTFEGFAPDEHIEQACALLASSMKPEGVLEKGSPQGVGLVVMTSHVHATLAVAKLLKAGGSSS